MFTLNLDPLQPRMSERVQTSEVCKDFAVSFIWQAVIV